MRSVNIDLLNRWDQRINKIAREAWASQLSGEPPADAGKKYIALQQLCQRVLNYDASHGTGLTADAAYKARCALEQIEPILRPYAKT